MATILGRPSEGAHFREICDAVSALTTRPVVFRAHRHRPPPGSIIYHWENNPLLKHLERSAAIWDFSSSNVARYPARLRPKVLHVPCGHHPSMERRFPASTGERFDIAWFGSLNDRRRKLLSALRSRGLSVVVLPVLFGSARDEILSRARLLLNVRYYESGVFPVLRSAHAAANLLPCLAEISPEMPSWVLERVTYERVTARAVELLRNPDALAKLAKDTLTAFRACPLRLPP